jgi:hypothetical protein
MHTRPIVPSKRRATRQQRLHPVAVVPPHQARADDGEAFFHDPHGGPARTTEQLGETLAEEFLQSATSAQEVSEEIRDAVVPEELGGPFVQHSAEEEFADGVDEANPVGAQRAAFPTATRLDR